MLHVYPSGTVQTSPLETIIGTNMRQVEPRIQSKVKHIGHNSVAIMGLMKQLFLTGFFVFDLNSFFLVI
jgi:hypothetical protein